MVGCLDGWLLGSVGEALGLSKVKALVRGRVFAQLTLETTSHRHSIVSSSGRSEPLPRGSVLKATGDIGRHWAT